MATPQRLETVRRLQTTMATAYAGLGAWCLLRPQSVIALGFTPRYAAISNVTTRLFARCFGAQAMTCALVLGTSDMTAFSFTAFGLAMVPYLGWNLWFGAGPRKGMINSWMWLDCVGNLFFMGASLWCAKVLREEDRRDMKSRREKKEVQREKKEEQKEKKESHKEKREGQRDKKDGQKDGQKDKRDKKEGQREKKEGQRDKKEGQRDKKE
ncbi:hypothetical protein VTJ83DRAFT_6225 [Remersonia thermophila]|uniref:Uncharacterized protein n=1 Tax=Remersonia thermophila TaxID=72144 RepID=A0ABR4D509_9PEZI